VSITQAQCTQQGGTYVPMMPDGSGPGCRFIDTTQPVGSQVTYTPIDEGFTAYLSRIGDVFSDNVDMTLGDVVQARDDAESSVATAATSVAHDVGAAVSSAADATGLNQGILGFLSKILGVNLNIVLIVLALLAFYIVRKGLIGDVAKLVP
jgi:hypothetical protein